MSVTRIPLAISRVLAAKTSLAIRVDALGDHEGATIGYECREKVEARVRQLETGYVDAEICRRFTVLMQPYSPDNLIRYNRHPKRKI